MLRLSRDRLLVALAPATVSWVRVTGKFRPRVVAKHSLPVVAQGGQEPWQGAVAVLRQEAAQWKRERLAVSVVLSNHFVRYAVVPPLDRGGSREEALALARFHFTKVHGERAAAWDIRLASPLSTKPTLASAVDTALLEALKSCFPAEGKPRLVSVQPYTMSAFNFWRGRFGKEGAWLLLVEPGTACLAMLTGREWATIQTVRSGYATSENWPALLDREKFRTNTREVPRTVLTRSSLPDTRAPSPRTGWNFVMLEAPAVQGLRPEERESYAMALHAA